MEMEAVCSCETFVIIYESARCHESRNPRTSFNTPEIAHIIFSREIRQLLGSPYVQKAETPIVKLTVKCKAIPVQAWTGLKGSRRLRLPSSIHSAHEGCQVVSRTHLPPLPPRKYP